jgi:hypothetical protein
MLRHIVLSAHRRGGHCETIDPVRLELVNRVRAVRAPIARRRLKIDLDKAVAYPLGRVQRRVGGHRHLIRCDRCRGDRKRRHRTATFDIDPAWRADGAEVDIDNHVLGKRRQQQHGGSQLGDGLRGRRPVVPLAGDKVVVRIRRARGRQGDVDTSGMQAEPVDLARAAIVGAGHGYADVSGRRIAARRLLPAVVEGIAVGVVIGGCQQVIEVPDLPCVHEAIGVDVTGEVPLTDVAIHRGRGRSG